MLKLTILLALLSLGFAQDDSEIPANKEEEENLTVLNLSNQGLTSLNDYDFSKYPLLEELDLSNNDINHIKGNVLIDNIHLKKLNLSGNKNLDLPEFATLIISNIEELDLSNCNIEHLPANIFDGIVNLKILDLSENPLEENGIELSTLFALEGPKKLILPHIDEPMIKEICKELDITIGIKSQDYSDSIQCADVREGTWQNTIKEEPDHNPAEEIVPEAENQDQEKSVDLNALGDEEAPADDTNIEIKRQANPDDEPQPTDDKTGANPAPDGAEPEPSPQENADNAEPDPSPENLDKPESEPEPSPENEDKPEPSPENEDKPEPSPENEDKPEPSPENEDKPEPAPSPENEDKPEPEPSSDNENKPEPVPSEIEDTQPEHAPSENENNGEPAPAPSEGTEKNDGKEPAAENVPEANKPNENSDATNAEAPVVPDGHEHSETTPPPESNPVVPDQGIPDKVNPSDTTLSQPQDNVPDAIDGRLGETQGENAKDGEKQDLVDGAVPKQRGLINVPPQQNPEDTKSRAAVSEPNKANAEVNPKAAESSGSSTGTNVLVFLVVAVVVAGVAAFGYKFYKSRKYEAAHTAEPVERELKEIVVDKQTNGPNTPNNAIEEEPLMERRGNSVEIKEIDETNENQNEIHKDETPKTTTNEGSTSSPNNTGPHVPTTAPVKPPHGNKNDDKTQI